MEDTGGGGGGGGDGPGAEDKDAAAGAASPMAAAAKDDGESALSPLVGAPPYPCARGGGDGTSGEDWEGGGDDVRPPRLPIGDGGVPDDVFSPSSDGRHASLPPLLPLSPMRYSPPSHAGLCAPRMHVWCVRHSLAFAKRTPLFHSAPAASAECDSCLMGPTHRVFAPRRAPDEPACRRWPGPVLHNDGDAHVSDGGRVAHVFVVLLHVGAVRAAIRRSRVSREKQRRLCMRAHCDV